MAKATTTSPEVKAIGQTKLIHNGDEQGHVRYKFAPSSKGRQGVRNSPGNLLKEQSRPICLRKGSQPLRTSKSHLQKTCQATIAIPTKPQTPASYAMHSEPDIHEPVHPESSSAATGRATDQKLRSLPSPSLRDSPSFKTAITDPSFTTAIEEPSPSSTMEAEDLNLDPRRAKPVYKSNPTTQLCEFHELCYSSQYTRPVVEMLMEISEARSSSQPAKAVGGAWEGGEERQPLLSGDDESGRSGNEHDGSCCWIHRLWDVLHSA